MNVVITGATKGIGRAIAESFAEGENHIVAIARTVKDLNELQSHFIAHHPGCTLHTIAADLGKKTDIGKAAQWLLDHQLVPDVLVNNAGYFAAGSIQQEEEGALQHMLDINLFSAYHLTRALLEAMLQRGTGHIFNICSVASIRGFEQGGAYGISKYALLGFSRNLREELKHAGIKVTAVIPGATFTNSWQGSNIDPERIMADSDVAAMVHAASKLSSRAVVEDIVMRPQQGDL